MACQLLANLFAWGLKHEKQQPTVTLGLDTFTFPNQHGLKGLPPLKRLALGLDPFIIPPCMSSRSDE